nr:MAG TPA: hypothetical protein [Caudoviricetes sp.]
MSKKIIFLNMSHFMQICLHTLFVGKTCIQKDAKTPIFINSYGCRN